MHFRKSILDKSEKKNDMISPSSGVEIAKEKQVVKFMNRKIYNSRVVILKHGCSFPLNNDTKISSKCSTTDSLQQDNMNRVKTNNQECYYS